MTQSINLDADSMSVLVQKAILDSLTPEVKEKLVSDAIQTLIVPPKDSRPQFGMKAKSILEVAFERAVESTTNRLVMESIAGDPRVQAAIEELLHPLIVRLCDKNYEGLPDAIGEAVGRWLRDQARN
jgi:hypothetical protein